VPPRLLGQVQVGIQTNDLPCGGELERHGDLAVADLAQGAGVLAVHADGVGSLLGEAGVVQDQQALAAQDVSQGPCQPVADGSPVPGALAEELLQALFVILRTAVDAPEAFGHGAGALAPAVEEQAAEVEFRPGPSAVAAEVGEYVIQVASEVDAKAL